MSRAEIRSRFAEILIAQAGKPVLPGYYLLWPQMFRVQKDFRNRLLRRQEPGNLVGKEKARRDGNRA
jgi:hypothetical protein